MKVKTSISMTIYGLFVIFLAWTLGIIIPFKLTLLQALAFNIGGLLLIFVLSIILMLTALATEELNPVIPSIFLVGFGFFNGLITHGVFFVAFRVVPIFILVSTFGSLAGFFFIFLVAAIFIDVEEYPQTAIAILLLVLLGLGVLQLFLPFVSIYSIAIDAIVVIVFSAILFYDLEYTKKNKEEWVSNTLNIFLDLVNIAIRIISILIKIYSESE